MRLKDAGKISDPALQKKAERLLALIEKDARNLIESIIIKLEKGGDFEKLAKKYCSRCHVIGDYNRLGGIDSTPSFPGLARRSDFLERFQTFYQRRPHPVFVRIPGVARWSKAHPYAEPFTVTFERIDDLIAYVRTLRDKPRPKRRRRR